MYVDVFCVGVVSRVLVQWSFSVGRSNGSVWVLHRPDSGVVQDSVGVSGLQKWAQNWAWALLDPAGVE